jgi:SH3 domain protein
MDFLAFILAPGEYLPQRIAIQTAGTIKPMGRSSLQLGYRRQVIPLRSSASFRQVSFFPVSCLGSHPSIRTWKAGLLALFCIGLAPAETGAAPAIHYVTDTVNITMRRGDNISYRVVKTFSSGQRLDVLEQKDNGWSRVRARDGTDGWVLTRFLTPREPAAERLKILEEAHTKLTAERDQLKTTLSTLQDSGQKLATIESEVTHLRSLNGSSIELEKINQQLQAQVTTLQEQIQSVKEEKRYLERQSDTLFLLTGGGLILTGVLLGRINRTRRSPELLDY